MMTLSIHIIFSTFALESLEGDVKRANTLIQKYKNRGRFYLLVKCRWIVEEEVEQVTRDVGRSLATLSIANTKCCRGFFIKLISFKMRCKELSSRLGNLSVKQKTLIIWGENDRIVSNKLAVQLHCELPDAVLRQIPDCGHIPHLERPDSAIKLIVEFIQTEKKKLSKLVSQVSQVS